MFFEGSCGAMRICVKGFSCPIDELDVPGFPDTERSCLAADSGCGWAITGRYNRCPVRSGTDHAPGVIRGYAAYADQGDVNGAADFRKNSSPVGGRASALVSVAKSGPTPR